MFTNQLPEDIGFFTVIFTDFADRHFRKGFRKKHKKSKVWTLTEMSIVLDLERIASDLQRTQQVDQLWHRNNNWIFKYDFTEAKSNKSPKSSGNRCVCYLDGDSRQIQILLIYAKNDLPKNMGEQQYIESILKSEFNEFLCRCR